eukprot:6465620-Alexandrium_andersonii.AAC.1
MPRVARCPFAHSACIIGFALRRPPFAFNPAPFRPSYTSLDFAAQRCATRRLRRSSDTADRPCSQSP